MLEKSFIFLFQIISTYIYFEMPCFPESCPRVAKSHLTTYPHFNNRCYQALRPLSVLPMRSVHLVSSVAKFSFLYTFSSGLLLYKVLSVSSVRLMAMPKHLFWAWTLFSVLSKYIIPIRNLSYRIFIGSFFMLVEIPFLYFLLAQVII